MKKVIGLIVLAMMIVLPMKVNAGFGFQFNCDEIDETTNTKTCYIVGSTTGSSSLNKVNGTLTLQNMTVKSITASSPWTDYSNGTQLEFTSPTNVTGASFTIATIVFDINVKGQDCAVTFVPCYTEDGTYGCGNAIKVEEKFTCRIVDGKYYGKNGNEVTAEVYNAECVNNPQTGNSMPYLVIIAGIVLAVGVFTVSRKNTKLYKI